MLYEEDGPYRMFLQLRSWAGISHKVESDAAGDVKVITLVEDNMLAGLLSCPYCISVWLAIPAAVGVHYHWFDLPAVIGCIAGMVHITLKRLHY